MQNQKKERKYWVIPLLLVAFFVISFREDSSPVVIPPSYVGLNPSDRDFTTEDFILDSQWHDLYLGELIPVGIALCVVITVTLVDLQTDANAGFRPKGSLSGVSHIIKVPSGHVYAYEDIICGVDSNATVQYYCYAEAEFFGISIEGYFQ